MLRNTKLPEDGQSEEEHVRTPGYKCGHFLLFIITENKCFHSRVTADTEQGFITADAY